MGRQGGRIFPATGFKGWGGKAERIPPFGLTRQKKVAMGDWQSIALSVMIKN